MNKHTPGPWTADDYYITAGESSTAKPPHCIAVAPSGAFGNAFRPADAALIAAAPDLLAALIDFVDRGEWDAEEVIDGSPIARAISAIAKARGA